MELYGILKRKLETGMNSIVHKRRKKVEAGGSSCLVDDAVQLDHLPENCIYNILVRVPLESLSKSRFVCKSWFGIVNSTSFRNDHLHLHRSDHRGIIFYTPLENYWAPPRKVFSPESNSSVTDVHSSFHMKFMELDDKKDGTGTGTIKELSTANRKQLKIVASCNGLVVLKEYLDGRRLMLLNPVTREFEDVPMGTISSVPDGDLYGLAFCNASSSRRYYKLLHLFMKDTSSNLGCEIMDIFGSGGGWSWRAVDVVPPIERFHLLHSPVFAMGALRWIQCVDVEQGDCLVSLPLDDEKLKTRTIPSRGDGHNNSIAFNTVFAMGEFLGLSSRTGVDKQIEVWILRGDECAWEKQYSIDASGLGYMTPLVYCDGDDRLVFKCGVDCFYAYDRRSGHLKEIVMVNKWAATNYKNPFPYVNSLVSWRS